MTELINHDENLYMRVYNHYRELIESGQMAEGTRIPSIRRCAAELSVSRTTVEAAYLLLAADGYVISRPQSGYYVTGLQRGTGPKTDDQPASVSDRQILYDFSSKSVDRESFNFDLWRRYIKSALRQDERLLSYGEPQGEKELREVLASYVAATRNVVCQPEQIVVGAGTQSLLHILCPMLQDRNTVSFPAPSMVQGIAVFENYGFEVHIKDKDAPIVYVSPSRMNRMGDIMPVSRRLELIRHAAIRGSIIIEDDYENEFQYQNRPTPALFGLAGGKGVVYLGTFSRLLLPSIRISFMVLPLELMPAYQKYRNSYNQTASKTEQIALCQLIRDGHMAAHIRKLRRLYAAKTKSLHQALRQEITDTVPIGEHSLCVTIDLPPGCEEETVFNQAREAGIRFDSVIRDRQGQKKIILSSLTVPEEAIGQAAAAVAAFLAPIFGKSKNPQAENPNNA